MNANAASGLIHRPFGANVNVNAASGLIHRPIGANVNANAASGLIHRPIGANVNANAASGLIHRPIGVNANANAIDLTLDFDVPTNLEQERHTFACRILRMWNLSLGHFLIIVNK